MQIFIILYPCTPPPVDKFSLRCQYTPNDQPALTQFYDQSSRSIRLFEGMIEGGGENKERKTDANADTPLPRNYATFGFPFLSLG